jgi:hypothetical protein
VTGRPYIDRAREKPDRLAVFVERIKYAALVTFGLPRYAPSGHLLLVGVPPPCQAPMPSIGEMSGNRDYVGATRADTEATTK